MVSSTDKRVRAFPMLGLPPPFLHCPPAPTPPVRPLPPPPCRFIAGDYRRWRTTVGSLLPPLDHMAWYVVYRGRVPGVYSSWALANAQVSGFPNNSHQSFPTIEEAEAAYLEYTGGDAVPLLDNAPPPVQNLVQAQPVVFNISLIIVSVVCVILVVGVLVLLVFIIVR